MTSPVGVIFKSSHRGDARAWKCWFWKGDFERPFVSICWHGEVIWITAQKWLDEFEKGGSTLLGRAAALPFTS